GDEDSNALLDALKRATPADAQAALLALEQYLERHTNSAWAPSLRANLAICYRSSGRYTRALNEWENAWNTVKEGTSPNDRAIADFILAHWTQLLSSLARSEK